MAKHTKQDDRLNLRLSTELGRRVRDLANREGESIAVLVRRGLRLVLEEAERRGSRVATQ